MISNLEENKFWINNLKWVIKAEDTTIEEAYEIVKEDSKDSLNDDQLQSLLDAKISLIRARDGINSAKYSIKLSSNDQKDWYLSPSEKDEIWFKYRDYLINKKGWEEESVDKIDKESTQVLNSFINPSLNIDKRSQGLVLGYVQSGKTSNMAATISKAATNGYKYVIILAGLNEALRKQTQIRIQKDIVDHSKSSWHWLTDETNDFESIGPLPTYSKENKRVVICVIKKNVKIIEKLISKIEEIPSSSKKIMTTLIIDDECDQASPNTKEFKNQASEISRTNKLLRKMLENLRKVTYVGYTATPFAPLLTPINSPDGKQSLYPKDFIISLNEPKGYFGVNKLFRDQFDSEGDTVCPFIKRVSDSEIEDLSSSRKDSQDFVPSISNHKESSLLTACDYYLLSLAARACRNSENEHCCMMIHTSRFVDIHDSFKPLIEKKWLKPIKEKLKTNDATTLNRLESLWEDESSVFSEESRSNLDCPNKPEPFSEIKRFLLEQVNTINVIRENSNPENNEDRLNFESETIHAIVIGGDALSRGLTVEGLVCSFFIRSSKQYDTLMQMGRWFGYRKGYEDLPRIWMSLDLEIAFKQFTKEEERIRSQIERMREMNLSPQEWPIEVSLMSNINPTAKNKLNMKKLVEGHGSYFGKVEQTIKFQIDEKIHKKNKNAVEDLIIGSTKSTGSSFKKVENSFVLKDVGFEPVLKFLREFKFREKEKFKGLREFLIKEIDNPNNSWISKWNIGIKGVEGTPKIKLANLNEVQTVERSKVNDEQARKDGDIYIQGLMGYSDLLIDVDKDKYKEWCDEKSTKSKWDLAIEFRKHENGPRPLLIIYPITKDSNPAPHATKKVRLFDDLPEYQPHDIFGIGISFPNVSGRFHTKKTLKIDNQVDN